MYDHETGHKVLHYILNYVVLKMSQIELVEPWVSYFRT